MWFKYVVKNVARKHGKTATFMPKPLFGDNGSGMHVHQSLWKEGKPLFAGDGYAGLSRHGAPLHRRHHQARQVDRGAHQPDDQQLPAAGAGLRGAGQPRVLQPQPLGRRAHPHHAAQRPRRAASRCASPIPAATRTSRSAAMLMAGLDGIQNKIDPGDPARQGHLRAVARGAEGRAAHAGQPRRGARHARARPRVPAARRRLHEGRAARVARLQADQGAQPDPHAADAATSSTSTSTSDGRCSLKARRSRRCRPSACTRRGRPGSTPRRPRR